MTDQLISFETAKLAKEKGFDGKCFGGYDTIRYNHETGCEKYNTHPRWLHSDGKYESLSYRTKETVNISCILAPTQSLLQKWLREKHKIIVLIGFLDFSDDDNYFYSLINHPRELQEDEYYKTYEEALEQGLYQSLLLIK